MKSLLVSLLIGCVMILLFCEAQRAQSGSGASKQPADDNEFAEFEDPDDVSTANLDTDRFSQQQQQQQQQQQHQQKQQKQHTDQQSFGADNEAKGDAEGQSGEGPADERKTEDSLQKGGEDGSSGEKDDDDSTVENEDDEFSHFKDSEEFEEFDKEQMNPGGGKKEGKQDLKILPIPAHHMNTSWENFYLEMLMLSGLVVYFLNFLVGKTKNARLANAWFTSHKELLEANFSIVGDDGAAQPNTGVLTKDSEHVYSLWCSGRVCCEGMLVELRFLKRQDLVSVISRWIKPTNDQIVVKITMEEGDLDGFVTAICNKKRVNGLLKEYQDLATFCPEKKTPKPGIPDSFVLLSEIGEATGALLDSTVCKILRDYEDTIEYIHISDQYTGPHVSQDDTQNTKLPDLEKALIFCFKVGSKGLTSVHDMEAVKPLFKFVFYVMEKVKRIKLTKEAKTKSDKNRQKAMESYQKMVHSQRQEAAQVRREEKRRVEKERLLAEEDPDRARKLEERDQKKEQKRKQPKMKMLKVKGM